MWLLPLARTSGGGGRICLKPVMILFCLVLKATLSVSKVISLIRSTPYHSLGLLVAFAMLRCLIQLDLEGYSWNPGSDRKIERDPWKRKISEIFWWERNLAATREVGFSKIMAWDARRTGKENGIRHKNDARLSWKGAGMQVQEPPFQCLMQPSFVTPWHQVDQRQLFPVLYLYRHENCLSKKLSFAKEG